MQRDLTPGSHGQLAAKYLEMIVLGQKAPVIAELKDLVEEIKGNPLSGGNGKDQWPVLQMRPSRAYKQASSKRIGFDSLDCLRHYTRLWSDRSQRSDQIKPEP